MQPDLVKVATDAGFPHPENIIMMFVGGSQLHGIKLEGTDDTDIYGVFLETPDSLLGLKKMEHFVSSTSGQHEKNVTGDVDIVLYSLRKWIKMAINGNPTAINFLFAEPALITPAWVSIRKHRYSMISSDHAKHYVGYATSQLARLLGTKGQKNVNRKALEGIHGFDTKYALHVLRILIEGIELMQTGVITFPCTEKDLLMKVRRGEIPLPTVVKLAEHYIRRLKQVHEEAIEKERFDPIDRDLISRLVVDTYKLVWTMGIV